jgi:predicted small metal-binding protein
LADGWSPRWGGGPSPLPLRCDCGFEVTGEGDDELVTRAQIHAREVHSMQLSAELVLRLAKSTTEHPDG